MMMPPGGEGGDELGEPDDDIASTISTPQHQSSLPLPAMPLLPAPSTNSGPTHTDTHARLHSSM